MKIKLLDAFAGIGALHLALKRIGVEVELVGVSEIDVDAIISYAAIHFNKIKHIDNVSIEEKKKLLMDRNIGWDFEKQKSSIPRMKKEKLNLLYDSVMAINNLGDISSLNFNDLPDFDLFNLSFPCTSVSVAGRCDGFIKDDGTHTRSGLVKFGIDVVKAKKPSYIMVENVKGIIQKRFIDGFNSILSEIESLEYNIYYPTKEDKKGNKTITCLNAKNFGVPQNRERVFVICIRKDIDKGNFSFPIGADSGIRLKDILEQSVDEKFYLSNEKVEKLVLNTKGRLKVSKALLNKDINSFKESVESSIGCIGNVNPSGNGINGCVYDSDGLSPTVTTNKGEGSKISIKFNDLEVESPCIIAQRGRNKDNPNDRTVGAETVQMLEPNLNGVANTITTVEKDNYVLVKEATKIGYDIAREGDSINFEHPESKTRRGRVGKGIANTLTTSCNQAVLDVIGNFDNLHEQSSRVYSDDGISPTIMAGSRKTCTGGYVSPKIATENNIGMLGMLDIKGNDQIRRVYDDDGISPTISTMQGGNRQPKIVSDVDSNTNNLIFTGSVGDKDIAKDGKSLSRNTPQGNRIYSVDGIAATQTSNGGGVGSKTGLYLENEARLLQKDTNTINPKDIDSLEGINLSEIIKIRKLIPLETFRLMGFDDESFNKASSVGVSNSSLYKQAGNSIVVNVLEAIFKNLFKL